MGANYKPNLVYVAKIDNDYYVGAHTSKRASLWPCKILGDSGNYLNLKKQVHEISNEEYLERCSLVKVIECDSKEEALDLEIEMIKKYKDLYGDQCINKDLGGNLHGPIGKHLSEETKKKISNTLKGHPAPNRKKVRNKITGEIYSSLTECAKQINKRAQSISAGMNRVNSRYNIYEYIEEV